MSKFYIRTYDVNGKFLLPPRDGQIGCSTYRRGHGDMTEGELHKLREDTLRHINNLERGIINIDALLAGGTPEEYIND